MHLRWRTLTIANPTSLEAPPSQPRGWRPAPRPALNVMLTTALRTGAVRFRGLPASPYLGGQNDLSPAFQLAMGKRGFRKNSPASMAGIAKRLDDQEIAAVAAYFQQVDASAPAATQPKE